MTIHVKDFVYGHITISEAEDENARIFKDDNGNMMKVRIGDSLIVCSGSSCQKWIGDGVVDRFNDMGDPNRFLLDNTSFHVGTCAYIGILANN